MPPPNDVATGWMMPGSPAPRSVAPIGHMKRCLGWVAGWVTVAVGGAALACPFCGTVGPTLAMRRDAAPTTAVGSAAGPALETPAGGQVQPFAVGGLIRGRPLPDEARVTARVPAPVAGTALLFGGGEARADGTPSFEAVAADELLLAHVARAPDTGRPSAERLAFFAARLEHPLEAIAADAFAEFGQAPFAAVRAAAPALAARPLAEWLSDPGIDQRRRGFYGLALGIVAHAGLPADAPASSAPLRAALEANADDFRAGSDGLMGGLLVADGPAGLEWLVARVSPQRPVEQKQLLAALRFAWEELAATIPRERIVAATATLATSPVVAADAVIDLARERGWDHVDRVAGLWHSLGGDDPHVRRAVAGYLTACPRPEAQANLEALRRSDGRRLDEAIRAAGLLRAE